MNIFQCVTGFSWALLLMPQYHGHWKLKLTVSQLWCVESKTLKHILHNNYSMKSVLQANIWPVWRAFHSTLGWCCSQKISCFGTSYPTLTHLYVLEKEKFWVARYEVLHQLISEDNLSKMRRPRKIFSFDITLDLTTNRLLESKYPKRSFYIIIFIVCFCWRHLWSLHCFQFKICIFEHAPVKMMK